MDSSGIGMVCGECTRAFPLSDVPWYGVDLTLPLVEFGAPVGIFGVHLSRNDGPDEGDAKKAASLISKVELIYPDLNRICSIFREKYGALSA